MAKDKYGADNINYGKGFEKDPQFSKILSDTSIDDKVKITQVHKNINSLAGVLEKSQTDFHKQVKGISGSLSSTAKQQERIVKQIRMKEMSSSKEVKVIEKSVQQILGKLGYTIDILGKSSKKILIDTAKATKQTLSEYGRALNADFYINKGNFLAMTLAKASPIFGYFAGKFMETSVFRNFSNLIKEKMGLAVTYVANKMKDVLGRGRERVKDWYSKRKESKNNEKDIPKLASGGYIQKAGVAQLHAAEVVAPLNKLEGTMKFAMKPTVSKLDTLVKILQVSTLVSAARGIYKLFKRNKYSSFLSKDKNPQVKLAEDFANFYNIVTEKLDILIGPIKKGERSRTTQENTLLKIKKATEGSENKLGFVHSSLKKGLSSILTWVMMGFGFIKSALGSLLSLGGSALKLGGRGVLGGLKMAGKGVLGAGAWMGKNVGKFIGKHKFGVAAATAGTVYDAYQGYQHADEWGTSKTAATLGGALGGDRKGWAGAATGAMKGMMLGATVGSAVPVVGTLIGGLVGAVGGGILGAIGGQNIAKGLDKAWDITKKISEGIWNVLEGILSYPKKWFERLSNYVSQKSTDLWDWIKDLPRRMVEWLTSSIPSWVKTLVGIQERGSEIGTNATKTVRDLAQNIGQSASIAHIGVYEKGGIVPPAPGGGLDGRGGQFAIVHEGEQIIPKSVVKNSSLTGNVPSDFRMGSTHPDMVTSIIDKLNEMINSPDGIVGGVVNKLKMGYQKVKESLGPSSGFGWLSRLFESAGAGPSAIGWDRTGGNSYGYYQMSEKAGTIQQFLGSFPQYGKQFLGMNVGSPEFNQKWKQLGSTDPNFGITQHQFIKQKYLSPYLEKIKRDTGFDLSLRSPVLQEVVNSAAVQYGPGSGIIPKAIQGLPQTATDEELIKKIYEYKYANVAQNFKSSTPGIQASVANRIQKEASMALGALGSGEGVSPQSLPKARLGGVITKDGAIYAHAGEIIGPIQDVKDSILKAMLTKKDVAKMQSDKDLLTSNLINESSKGFQNAALDSMTSNGKQAGVIMSNVGNILSSSMNSLSRSISSGDGQGNNQGNDEIASILSARFG